MEVTLAGIVLLLMFAGSFWAVIWGFPNRRYKNVIFLRPRRKNFAKQGKTKAKVIQLRRPPKKAIARKYNGGGNAA
jgi:hypothetical protein